MTPPDTMRGNGLRVMCEFSRLAHKESRTTKRGIRLWITARARSLIMPGGLFDRCGSSSRTLGLTTCLGSLYRPESTLYATKRGEKNFWASGLCTHTTALYQHLTFRSVQHSTWTLHNIQKSTHTMTSYLNVFWQPLFSPPKINWAKLFYISATQ